MAVELGESDLTISVSKGDHPCDDCAVDRGVILDDNRTAFQWGVELDDFEESREADADVEKDTERVSCNHRARTRLPTFSPALTSSQSAVRSDSR